ncbi:MAG: hypothetical protein OXC11_02365 [Rhodospirillales bacterium]|nr:hypothetical protein [Rhodospirillales bacterium]
MPKLRTTTPIGDAFEKYRRMVVSAEAGAVQVAETRQAFFAGATVLFETIMAVLDPGEEPTADDLKAMETLDAELRAFGSQFDVKHMPAKGRG